MNKLIDIIVQYSKLTKEEQELFRSILNTPSTVNKDIDILKQIKEAQEKVKPISPVKSPFEKDWFEKQPYTVPRWIPPVDHNKYPYYDRIICQNNLLPSNQF